MKEYNDYIERVTKEFIENITIHNSEESIRWLNTNLINYEDYISINKKAQL